MRDHLLNFENQCSEDWNSMSFSQEGKFCIKCSKSVVDLTHLSNAELRKRLAQENNFCGRLSQNELKTTLIDFPKGESPWFNYSKVAAGLVIISTLTNAHAIEAKKSNLPLEMCIHEENEVIGKTNFGVIETTVTIPINASVFNFKGLVVANDTGKPIENAKILLATKAKIIATYSSKNGSFELKIPKDLIKGNNVFRIIYSDAVNHEETSYGFESEDYVLTNKEIYEGHTFKANKVVHYLGGIGYYANAPDPSVYYKGKKIKYKTFDKALDGKSKKFDMSNKYYYYFEEEAGSALDDKSGFYGVYLVYDK
ncbi:hypothetical protein [Nonlabens ponticola]|uniref:Uncharacterized protein n=1 Tax=Nonlabens ponticola TaxID=2496866 RepID=A0A3S9MXZ5_9FLAO|nr:hypothetical protein [Nonlabens ponticola]AZQ44121.1 hypothetical protein EJ995_07705 [Nonlabens ponticola]